MTDKEKKTEAHHQQYSVRTDCPENFEQIRELGEGGFGVANLVKHRGTGVFYVIKSVYLKNGKVSSN